MRIVLLAIMVVSSGCASTWNYFTKCEAPGGGWEDCREQRAKQDREQEAAIQRRAAEEARLAAEQLRRKAWCMWATQDATSTATPEQRQECYAATLAEQAQRQADQQQNTEAQLQIQRQALQDARDAEERRRKAEMWRDIGRSFEQPKSVTTNCSPSGGGGMRCTTN